MIGTHVVPDRQQYDGNTPFTSYLVHVQLLYGILQTTTSRPNNNTSTISLYVNSRASFHFGRHVIYQTLKQIQNNRQLYIISRNIYTYTYTRQIDNKILKTQHARHREKPGIIMTGNYNYKSSNCIKNTTAVWNLTPLASIAFILATFIKSNNHTSSYNTLYQEDNSNSDLVSYWTMIGTHVVPDRQQYDGNTPFTSYLVHVQLLYGILQTTTSRPNNNTSTISLYVNSRASFHFGRHVIYQTLKQIQNNRQLYIISRNIYTYTYTRQIDNKILKTQHARHREKPGIIMTGNYNYKSSNCIKNTTAVWNLTPLASIAFIPQQRVIHQASKQI